MKKFQLFPCMTAQLQYGTHKQMQICYILHLIRLDKEEQLAMMGSPLTAGISYFKVIGVI